MAHDLLIEHCLIGKKLDIEAFIDMVGIFVYGLGLDNHAPTQLPLKSTALVDTSSLVLDSPSLDTDT